MAISGSITKVSSTTTSITVSWNVTTNSSGFAEVYVTGAGQTLYEGSGVGKPVTGTATVSSLSPGTAYTFSFGGIDNFNQTGGQSYSFSTDSAPPPPPSDGKLDIYSGGAWVSVYPKVYLNGSWVSGTVYVYNGTSWAKAQNS